MRNAYFGLVFSLRLVGAFLILAIGALFLPARLLAAIPGEFGYFDLPDHPAVPYLARSLAALYVTWGLAAVFVSFDVPRYLRLIRFMAVVALAFGALMLFLDLGLGLPRRWVLTEGPIIMLIGAFFLLLSRKPAPAAAPVSPPVPDEPVGVA
jgi:hypothetical protein